MCFITNPIWVVKTRLQLQRKTLQQAAAVAAAAAPAQAAAAAAGQAAATAAGGAAPGATAAAAAGGIPRLLSSAAAGGTAEACALEYRGFLHAFVQIARCEGLRGLYKGLLPSLLLVSWVGCTRIAMDLGGPSSVWRLYARQLPLLAPAAPATPAQALLPSCFTMRMQHPAAAAAQCR